MGDFFLIVGYFSFYLFETIILYLHSPWLFCVVLFQKNIYGCDSCVKFTNERENCEGRKGARFLYSGNYFIYGLVENYLTRSDGTVLMRTFGWFKLDLDYI